ncbi:hypothetical protein, partial [Bacteroides cellulosilyticus]|uniref:hypothetical protein n=1 Tax=Bacteroides cellulosilyticus TaxID=246787 RepID=UPI0032C1C7FB
KDENFFINFSLLFYTQHHYLTELSHFKVELRLYIEFMYTFTYTLALTLCIALFIGNTGWCKQIKTECRQIYLHRP